MKKILKIIDSLLNIIIFLTFISTAFVLAQNRITVFKTDNRNFKFYYNPTTTAGYERELIFGVSSYSNDVYGRYSGGNNGSFGYPLLEFKPKPTSNNYLADLNKNIFRILNLPQEKITNLTAIRIGSNPTSDPDSYSRILLMSTSGNIVFDYGVKNRLPTNEEFVLSYLYADIGDLIAVYSCEETRENQTCLGLEGVYKIGTQPPGARFKWALSGNQQNGAAFYQNPDYCFGAQNLGRILQHICLGDCGPDDEALTFCIRTK